MTSDYIAAAMPVTPAPATRVFKDPHQNWILNPYQDGLFIIAAPIITLALALGAFAVFPAEQAITLILTAHIIMTVAHHLPTFIRIYGDVELFRRFKWSFVLGPVVPLAFSAGVIFYLHANDLPVEYFLYLWIMLVLWDPWHFLRQHYGFMRLYDRHNAAPNALAARMDLWVCAIWFIYIMLASSDWLVGLLQDLYSTVRIPAVLWIGAEVIAAITTIAQYAAIAMTLAYALYTFWCWRRGYFVSIAKIALLVCTFAAMYVAYTPNEWMQSVVPEWSFKVGFATIGIVHMTQYLAIVWRYNRSLTQRPERARAGVFRALHSRGGWLIAAAYVGVCLGYGDLLTTRQGSDWLMSILLPIGFTSTLMHYYFDGFIWKVRHRQNREALLAEGTAPPADTGATSWWSANSAGARTMLLRQLLYFCVPMAVLTVGAMSVWAQPQGSYIAHMLGAQRLSEHGLADEAVAEARTAFTVMQAQLPYLRSLAQLQPTAAREAELAFLIHDHSLYRNVVLPSLDAGGVSAEQRSAHRQHLREAAEMMASALSRGGTLAHAGRERLDRTAAKQIAASWRAQVAQ